MATTLQGIVTDIPFQNEDTGYTVLHLQTPGEPKTVTCVGVMPTVGKGESVTVDGSWETHRRFGRQFTVERYSIVRPTTVEGILHLLGSGLIASIGPARAKLIVDRFGLETLAVLDNEPDRLLDVHGVGPRTMEKIKDAWQKQRHIRDLMLFLQEIGVTVNLAMRIYKVYGRDAKEKISSDPYALLDDVWGVGFIKADRIAQKMGFKHDSYRRIRAGLRYALDNAAGSDGHCFLPAETLAAAAMELLGVGRELVVYTLDHAVTANIFVRDGDRIFLPVYYHAEKTIAQLLLERIGRAPTAAIAASPDESRQWLAAYQRRTGWQADPVQAEAIIAATQQPLFLLTGGPGTGKTAILQVIVTYFREKGRQVVLAAPTGRAAQRMGSVAGISARTIHRLLEFKGGPGHGERFLRNAENPIAADVLIIDEMSMVDVPLMRSLLLAAPATASLIFVGDNHQLPSVGPGNVLGDLIASRRIPHRNLTTIFRQAASSRIVTAAHEIIRGEVPSFTNGQTDDCFFLDRNTPESCLDAIVDLVARRLPSRYGFDPVADIQVLSPMHRGPLGTGRSAPASSRNSRSPPGKFPVVISLFFWATRSCRSATTMTSASSTATSASSRTSPMNPRKRPASRSISTATSSATIQRNSTN